MKSYHEALKNLDKINKEMTKASRRAHSTPFGDGGGDEGDREDYSQEGFSYHIMSLYANPARECRPTFHHSPDLAYMLSLALKTALNEKRDITVWKRDVSEWVGIGIATFDEDGGMTVKNVQKLTSSESKIIWNVQLPKGKQARKEKQ